MSEQQTCTKCKGSGSWPFPTRQLCPRCKGSLVEPSAAVTVEPEAPNRMQQIETLLEEEVFARTAYEEDGVSASAHYLGLIMELAPPELHKRLTDPVIDRTQDREPVAIVTLQSDVGGRAFDIDWTLAADALEPGQHKLYTHPPVEPEGARDHEAMEILRSASLKKGWKWQWDGMDLQQVTLGPNAPNTHKDPADAALASQPADGS